MQQYLPFTVLKLIADNSHITISTWLQQYLPFTVLKQENSLLNPIVIRLLQQYLPFTVLKLYELVKRGDLSKVATVPTVYGIETARVAFITCRTLKVATVPTVYGIETRNVPTL